MDNFIAFIIPFFNLLNQDRTQLLQLLRVQYLRKSAHTLARSLPHICGCTIRQLHINRLHQCFFIHLAGLAENNQAEAFKHVRANV